jgi:endoglucanase
VQADGRVVDRTFEQKSTSEGQSYALFFALVANDRPRFDAILRWTSENLAGGKLGERLPAWHWGIGEGGRWGIKDANSAADGDLWIAYALLEAARLWNAPQYAETGRKLLRRIASDETVNAGGGIRLLLPAPQGFELDRGRVRIDPSYIPPFQFRYFGTLDPKGPWLPILDTYLRLSPKIFTRGIAPDLIVVDAWGKVQPDIDRTTASYDAIRVYLWAAMSGRDGLEQLRLLRPFAELIRAQGMPPEKVETASGKPVPNDWAPIGFMAAVLPYLQVLGEQALLEQVHERLRRERGKTQLTGTSNYYDEALVLFGLGWFEQRYRFDEQGRLQPRWPTAVPDP